MALIGESSWPRYPEVRRGWNLCLLCTLNCAANGVMVETVQFLTHIMTEGTRLKNLPELLAASGESRAMKVEREDDKDMQQICDAVVETKKRVFTMPVIVR